MQYIDGDLIHVGIRWYVENNVLPIIQNKYIKCSSLKSPSKIHLYFNSSLRVVVIYGG